MTRLIQCSHCLRERPASRRDAVLCADCDAELYRHIKAGEKRIEAMDPEARRAAGAKVFSRVQRNLPPIYQRARER